jgi:hypothetical protein
VPAAYDALIEYATRGGKVAALLDPRDRSGARGHFDRAIGTLRVLRAIVDDELANRPLTAREKHWLGMVTELTIDTSEDITGYPPVYSGWYFDLFLEAEADGMRGADFIADYFTSVEDGISYVGASAPRLGVFVVDTGGPPRAFVGPVARAYETHTPLATRLTDETAAAGGAGGRAPRGIDARSEETGGGDPDGSAGGAGGRAPRGINEPWAASYTVARPAAPPDLTLHYDRETGHVIVHADSALGPATVKLLDHHRVPLATVRQAIHEGDNAFAFHRTSKVGAVTIAIGAWRDWAVGDSYGEIAERWGRPRESPEE